MWNKVYVDQDINKSAVPTPRTTYMKQPAPSSRVSFVGDRHTVELASLDKRPGLKELRSMRKRVCGRGEHRGEGGENR